MLRLRRPLFLFIFAGCAVVPRLGAAAEADPGEVRHPRVHHTPPVEGFADKVESKRARLEATRKRLRMLDHEDYVPWPERTVEVARKSIGRIIQGRVDDPEFLHRLAMHYVDKSVYFDMQAEAIREQLEQLEQ